jgi:hypothetical protein
VTVHLEKVLRFCAVPNCGGRFRVLKDSPQKTCGQFCEEKLSGATKAIAGRGYRSDIDLELKARLTKRIAELYDNKLFVKELVAKLHAEGLGMTPTGKPLTDKNIHNYMGAVEGERRKRGPKPRYEASDFASDQRSGRVRQRRGAE